MNKLINIGSGGSEEKIKSIMESLESYKLHYAGINMTSLINYIINNFRFDVDDYIKTLDKRDEKRINFLKKNKDYYKFYWRNKNG